MPYRRCHNSRGCVIILKAQRCLDRYAQECEWSAPARNACRVDASLALSRKSGIYVHAHINNFLNPFPETTATHSPECTQFIVVHGWCLCNARYAYAVDTLVRVITFGFKPLH